MQVKTFNTTNGVFISLETQEFVFNLKKPYRTKQAAQKALKEMIRRSNSEKFFKEGGNRE